MSHLLTAAIAFVCGTLLGVLLREAASHDDRGLLGWEDWL